MAKKTIKPRDQNILAACKREINLNTQTIRDKKKYTRKIKHKKDI